MLELPRIVLLLTVRGIGTNLLVVGLLFFGIGGKGTNNAVGNMR